MLRNIFCRGVGVFLVIAVLGVPGLAAAETARGLAAGELGPALLWKLLSEIFLGDEATPPPPQDSGGGGTDQGGGAMDPNGGPKPIQPPPPPPPPSDP